MSAQCRSAGNRTVVAAEMRACKLPVDGEHILHAAGKFVLALPYTDACVRLTERPCGVVKIEKASLVATLTDARGKVLRTLDFEQTTTPDTIVVPCSPAPGTETTSSVQASMPPALASGR